MPYISSYVSPICVLGITSYSVGLQVMLQTNFYLTYL